MPEPTPFYYPSIVVNLRLRFDESFAVVNLPEPLDQRGSIADTTEPAGPRTRPLITETGKDNLSHLLNRVPKNATVELPGYRTAGKFSFLFDYRELPIDPRLIRQIGVEIYQGTVNPEDFSTGMTQIEPDGTRRSVLNVYDASGTPRDDLMTLAGVIDTWRMTHDDKGSYIQMEGRDLRGIFLDSPLDLRVFDQINQQGSIIEVVAALLSTHPQAEAMNLQVMPDEWPGSEIPSPADKDGLTRVRRKADGSGASVGSSSSKPNYWDMVTQLCTLVGAIPYFVGRELHIRKARSIYSQLKPALASLSPFRDPSGAPKPRADSLGERYFVRRMVYGRNLKSLTFERKFTGTRVPVLELVSHDQSGTERGPGKLLIVQWPPKSKKAARISGVSPSGKVAQTDILRIPIPGIRSKDRLLEIAKDLFEEIGRQEIGGSVITNSLSSLNGDNSDPDMLRLRPGDGVEFSTDVQALNSRTPISSQFTDAGRMSFDERVDQIKRDMLQKSGTVDENLVRVIVASSRSSVIDLLQFFRVSGIKYAWQNGVVTVSFDFRNYISTRYDEVPAEKITDKTETRVVSKRIRPDAPRPTPDNEGIRPIGGS